MSLFAEIQEEDPAFAKEKWLQSTQDNLKRVSRSIQFPDIKMGKYSIKILDTDTNFKWLMERHSISARYNMMTRKREITLDKPVNVEDYENYALSYINSICALYEMPIAHIDQYLEMMALENAYHPIVEILKNNPWDGISRVKDFCNTLTSDNQELSNQILTTWMVAAVAAAHSINGFVQNGVLVLQGAQGIGKTSFIKQLSPIDEKVVKIGAFLDPNNKDSVIQLSEAWIAELGELDSVFTKSAIGRIKSYITMDADIVRNPYARKSTRLPRRTAYAASVNEETYLIDETGNRRWWTISVTAINLQHGLDMLQIWSEIYHMWKNGHITYLNADLQNKVNDQNQSYEKIDPIHERLITFYQWDIPVDEYIERTATDIYHQLFGCWPTKSEVTKLGMHLKNITKLEWRRTNKERLYKIPPRWNASSVI